MPRATRNSSKKIIESDDDDEDEIITRSKKIKEDTNSLDDFIVNDEGFFKSKWYDDDDDDYNIPMSGYKKNLEGMMISEDIKKRIMGMISNLDEMNMPNGVNDGEKYKLKKYIDNFIKIPFGKYKGEIIKKDDSFDKKSEFLRNIKTNMDKYVFGQKNAKDTILEVIAKRINNPDGKGNIIALVGPPGVGKTSLIRDGLTKSYNVPFNFVTLGGARNVNILRGCDYSYIGSGWGRIVDILIKSQCMDPVIFFDEMDKISLSDDGMDIISSLVHLTDPSQNTEWEDLYFSGIPFDLSRATIFFSLNDIKNIPGPLLDRLTVIKMGGFSSDEKVHIAKKYCVPKLCRDIGFGMDEIIIGDDTIKTIIKHYCFEEGIRKLEKCIRIIMMKFNYYHMIELGKEDYGDVNPYKIDPSTAKIILDPIMSD